jgi:hypothetical protein
MWPANTLRDSEKRPELLQAVWRYILLYIYNEYCRLYSRAIASCIAELLQAA